MDVPRLYIFQKGFVRSHPANHKSIKAVPETSVDDIVADKFRYGFHQNFQQGSTAPACQQFAGCDGAELVALCHVFFDGVVEIGRASCRERV